MAYYINLFSPETYETFTKSSQGISGFRVRQENAASRIKVGDKLICYMTKLGRWVGILEVESKYFKDNSPIFYLADDPFVIRFKVKPVVWLSKEKALPIRNEQIWNNLSFTKGYDINSSFWTGKLRNSLNALDDKDGSFLEQVILEQSSSGKIFEIDEQEYEKLVTHKVRRIDKVISVSVPQDNLAENKKDTPQSEVRESIKIQALLAKIGIQMGLKIWLPRNDRNAVISELKGDFAPLVDILPLNYDETTLKTIEQIDVLWLKGRSIVRAFEVEHTTSIYSGILRMADLLALQPNMDIKLHIVAPDERREKVFQELRRPVFSLLERGPLSESCTYLSYESVTEISKEKHLSHLSDSVLDEYAEPAE
ncbi:MAG TPA: EVE domain-containing protein [Anaerolineales bacterium]|nr:EVE domain-containing protein [Anaerolineales bacterium]